MPDVYLSRKQHLWRAAGDNRVNKRVQKEHVPSNRHLAKPRKIQELSYKIAIILISIQVTCRCFTKYVTKLMQITNIPPCTESMLCFS